MRVSLVGFRTLLAVVLALPLLPAARARADDWPQWRGPNRDGISRETGLLKEWPKGGPPLAFQANGLGEGYSSVSVAGGRIFTMGNRGKEEFVIALTAEGGKEAWSTLVGPVRANGGGYPGPRATPTVDGDVLYTLGLHGDLLALDAATGHERWRKDLQKDFGGRMPGWGYSESPLVDGDRILCTPGGKDATIVALEKKTGNLVWKASIPRGKRGTKHDVEGRGNDGAQYSSIVKGKLGGLEQYVQFLETGVAGIATRDGRYLWRYNRSANGTANISTPIIKDGLVFTASGYGTGGGLVKLTQSQGSVQVAEVYFADKMKNHHGGLIVAGDYLYGFDEGVLRCLEFKTGKRLWENRSVGKGSLVYADGRLYARSEGGPVALVEATPSGYVEKGRFDQPSRSGANAWPHPVVAGGRLYLRDQDVLLVYDVRNRATAGRAPAGSGGK